jgi:hypothetical protein
LDQIPKPLIFSVSDELIPVFEAIFDHFSGGPINFEQFPLQLFLDSFEILQITAGKDLLQSLVSKPYSLEEAIHFVQTKQSDFFPLLRQNAFDFIQHNFDSISLDLFNSLSFQVLSILFSLRNRTSKEENQLFSIFLQLCEIDDQKLSLFPKLNHSLLKWDFLEKALKYFSVHNLTSDIFESFKKNIFAKFFDYY